jgi:hypothetical protein
MWNQKAVLTVAIVLSGSLLTGCAATNDALTPSLAQIKDDFDGSLIVRQVPVSAASSLGEAWHTLGFEWTQKTPDTVYLTAGAHGIVNVEKLAFNADGRIIDNIRTASATTEYGQWSTRRFAMSWDDFVTVANARSVKMRVSMINEYTVSSFGPAHPATVDSKISPFVARVQELRAAKK